MDSAAVGSAVVRDSAAVGSAVVGESAVKVRCNRPLVRKSHLLVDGVVDARTCVEQCIYQYT